MAFVAAIRRSSSLAARSLRSIRSSPSGVFRPLLVRVGNNGNAMISSSYREGFGGSLRFYSSASDSTLIDVIKAEIECAEESDDHDQDSEMPNKFPFEIKDEQGTSTIVLTRNFHGENVEVVVSMPSIVSGDDDVHDGSGGEQQDEGSTQSSLPLIVKVSKGNGPNLEFCCTAFADEVAIDSLSVKEQEDGEEDDLAYEGPDFSDLDENLQKAFHKYLEIRGISPATTNFLHEYMVNKDSREYLLWLKKLEKFVFK